MMSALRPLERYTLYSKVSIHEAPVALHDMAFTLATSNEPASGERDDDDGASEAS